MANAFTTAWLQTRTELRIAFSSPTVVIHFGVPVFFVWILGKVLVKEDNLNDPVLVGALFSAITSYAALVAFNLLSEAYTERISGNFVRIRTLPKGVQSWMIGKVLLNLIQFLMAMVAALIALPIFVPDLVLSWGEMAALVAITGLGVMVFAPYGFIFGMFVRSVAGFMVAAVVSMGLYVATAGFFPTSTLPTWLAWGSLISPFYWLSYTARAVQLSADAGQYEVFGLLSPYLAFGVLAAWGIVGWALGPRIVQKMMRKETIGRLSQDREKTRSMSGL